MNRVKGVHSLEISDVAEIDARMNRCSREVGPAGFFVSGEADRCNTGAMEAVHACLRGQYYVGLYSMLSATAPSPVSGAESADEPPRVFRRPSDRSASAVVFQSLHEENRCPSSKPEDPQCPAESLILHRPRLRRLDGQYVVVVYAEGALCHELPRPPLPKNNELNLTIALIVCNFYHNKRYCFPVTKGDTNRVPGPESLAVAVTLASFGPKLYSQRMY
jgi:hypothetical protein